MKTTLSQWKETVLAQLDNSGEEGRATVNFLRARRTPISIQRHNKAVGAIWTMWGSIQFNREHFSTETPANNPRLLCLLVHEARHLQQGPITALSIYGELDAWQVDFRFYQLLTAQPLSPPLVELLSLPLRLDRDILKRAQTLMIAHAGKGYRADLLPLYPIHHEIRYWANRIFRR